MKISLTKTHWTIITITYMGLLMWASLKPVIHGQHASYAVQAAHNLLHVPAYAVLTFFLLHTIGSYKLKLNVALWAFFIAVFYGAFNEIVQSFTPGRSCSVMDVGLNALGAGIALFFLKERLVIK